MLAKVAIDLALDRLFTYEVPQELEKKLAVGQLLSVPFGSRVARGFVMELEPGDQESEAGNYKLKKIISIVDEVPFFSERLLDIVRRIAQWTVSPVENVLKAAVPAAVLKSGAHEKTQLYVDPADGKAGAAKKGDGLDVLTRRQAWVYENLVRLGGGWMHQLCAELGTTATIFRELERKGCAKIEERQRFRAPLARRQVVPSKALALNPGQVEALEKILKAEKPVLLHGITGSGKTEIYLQAIARKLDEGRGAIVMVPEIALTPQTVQRFASRFGDKVAVLHSALSDGERYDEWHRIRSGKALVVVGPRSAVFAPVKNLGIIIVDEEHEGSYKQEDTPRYNARDVAVLRGKIEGALVVLGSATPSLESYRNAQTGKYSCVTLTERAGGGTLPAVRLVDMDEGGETGIYSKELLAAIAKRLDRGEQTILFLNRRGYSRSLTCKSCGGTVDCDSCDTPYTYHRADNCLRCHLCGGWRELPHRCPHCGSDRLSYRGIGTQRAEIALQKCFRRARILRMDADSTRGKNSHDDILGAFRRHEADILLGTQMIAKGLDFPNVTLVGVLNADQSLNMPDFRAAERTFQLLAQVSGRAGRSRLPGEVVIQTRNASNPAIKAACACDYVGFAAGELADRREAGLPPWTHLSVIRFKSRDRELAERWAEFYSAMLAKAPGKMRVSDAMPSAIEKQDGYFRYQVVITSELISPVVSAYRQAAAQCPPPKAVKMAIDIDAHNIV